MRLSEPLEMLLAEVEDDPNRVLSEKEKVVIDVIETSSLILEDGLHAFWFSSLNEDLAIKGFDEVGAYEIVDLIQSSQWCKSSSEERSEFSNTEEEHLSEIEAELMPMFEDLSDYLEEYLAE